MRSVLRLRDDENRLLKALPPEDFELLKPHLAPAALLRGDVLFDALDTIEHVYFPQSGVVSLVTLMRDGSSVEAGTIGREGAVGLITGSGTRQATTRGVVQIPGRARRIEVARFRAALERSAALRDLVDCYTEALLSQVLQTVACNALHSVEQRFCRWLLTCRDRTGSDVIPLTQEAVAEMLGVQRTTVTAAARALQNQGLIRYRRGLIECVDLPGLHETSCECYDVVRSRFQQLLPLTYQDPPGEPRD
ncbi:MAG: Crp/Fnr family transcriptional regulator [Salinarimonas sp.]